MSTAVFVVLAVVVLAVLALAIGVWLSARRRGLQKRFGPEYDRVSTEQPSRGAAEQELRGRERKHAELELQSLSLRLAHGTRPSGPTCRRVSSTHQATWCRTAMRWLPD
jgi:hypothetical protein